MPVPDVSVVIAVHPAMPGPTACPTSSASLASHASLASLAGQTIGRSRMEVIAVDHGSTDGSGAELNRFAARHPDLVRVLRQRDSGGPAAAANCGSELARGRYVLHLGAGDRLGPQALERLVAAADRLHADIVIPRHLDDNGRAVQDWLFQQTVPDADFVTHGLAWALAGTKLFRRELLLRHGLRHREDLPAHADQPFTLEAMLRAERISVLSDYDYLGPRADRSAATGSARIPDRLRAVRALAETAARVAGPGPRLDAVRQRLLGWDVPRQLQAGFLALDETTQQQVCAETAALVDRHCPATLLAALPVPDRLRLALAQRGELAALRGVIAYEVAHGTPPTVRHGGRRYAAHPCFRSARLPLPDALFEIRDDPGTAAPKGRLPLRSRLRSRVRLRSRIRARIGVAQTARS